MSALQWIRFLPLLALIALSAPLCFSQPPVWQSPIPSPAEAASLLQAICPDSVQVAGVGAPKSLPGCKPCPDFTTVGRLQPGMANRETFGLESVIYGSFTAPGIVQAVASFEGCEPHTSLYGGSILLRKIGGSWSMVRYLGALITHACRTYRLPAGRDLLLCEQEDHHAIESGQWMSVVDLTKREYPYGERIFGVADTSGACGPTAVGGAIDSAALTNSNGDDMPDLKLGVTVVQTTLDEGVCLASDSATMVQKYKLDFLFQPDTLSFLPAPSSKATVDKLEALFKGAGQKAVQVYNRRLHH